MNKGFSIVEFMIAITLGTLLVATAGSVYVSNKKTFRVQEALSRLQENARFAVYHLNKQIRMAGHQGCANKDSVQVTNLVSNPSNLLNFDNPILGYDGSATTFTPTLPTHLSGKPALDSDLLEIRLASVINVQLRRDMNRTNQRIRVYDRFNIQDGDVLFISDCRIGDIFAAGTTSNSRIITHTTANNISNHLSFAYTAGSQVMQFQYYSFYVKDTGRTNASNESIYGLYELDADGNETELVEGVEKMRILYGVDNNGDYTADEYQSATAINTANNWDNVISARINLLFSTNENVIPKAQPYEFDGTTYTPSDRRLRREWTTFINLRNRGLP